MTQLSCKRDTKSKSHPRMKLAPVRVFPCKHPDQPYSEIGIPNFCFIDLLFNSLRDKWIQKRRR